MHIKGLWLIIATLCEYRNFPSQRSKQGCCVVQQPSSCQSFSCVSFQVEFPEARIFEETLNILIYENNRSGPGGVHLLDSRGSGSGLGAGQSEEEGAAGGDRRVRRIHVRRHIMHDERGHGQQTVYKD